MFKLFQFFLAYFGYAYTAVIDGFDVTGMIRTALEREKTVADLQALRASVQTFITEIDMEIAKRPPDPPLGKAFDDDFVRTRLNAFYGRRA